MDKTDIGYINIDHLYKFLNEELSSIISPYLERFFCLIKREEADKITFLEWLPATSVFCLFTFE